MSVILTLKTYVPVYRWSKSGGVFVTSIGGRTFTTEAAARRLPRGPNVPRGMQIIDVLEVEWTERK